MNSISEKNSFSIIQILGIVLFSLLFMWSNIAIAVVGVNSIILLNAAICMLFIFIILYWNKIKQINNSIQKFLRNIVLIIIGLLVVIYLSFSALMIAKAFHIQNSRNNETVIVLGCKINGKEPSLMLKKRLDVAYDFLNSQINSKCVVCGGQGNDEITSESSVMKEYLTKKGISNNRIYIENQSTNTQENLQYAIQIIEKEKLNKCVVIATDDFHQARSQYHGKMNGLTVASAGHCITPWYMIPYYWTREVLGMAYTLVYYK